jgi:membrane protein DedA with SNARE-associated domain
MPATTILIPGLIEPPRRQPYQIAAPIMSARPRFEGPGPRLEETLQFLIRHGYLVLFLFVFAEQIGLPLPALPILLGAGALARTGQIDYPTAIVVAVAASLLSDLIWYEVGRRRGGSVLRWLCKISLEPDSCVRTTEGMFARYGARSLIVAKFVPGLNTVAPPMSGIFGMRLWRFLLFDTIGALIWVVAFTLLGYVFSNQLERIVSALAQAGGLFVAVLIVPLVAYIGVRFAERRRVLRDLSIARITPEELNRRIESGEDIAVVDLRHPMEFAADPTTIPGALHVPAEELDERYDELPVGREIVLFCT